MTKSNFINPDADSSVNDFGVSEPRNIPLTDEERADYQEKLGEMENDLIF